MIQAVSNDAQKRCFLDAARREPMLHALLGRDLTLWADNPGAPVKLFVAGQAALSLTDDYAWLAGRPDDLEELDNSQENFEEEYEELTSFDRSQLTESQQITYDILLWTMETDRQSLGLEYYQELCSPLLGIQSQLPSLLGEYAFREEQDVEDYLAITPMTNIK